MGQRIVFPARSEVRLDTFEQRAPAAGEVAVRTLYSLMSIGTETTILHAKYDSGTHFDRMFSFPQLKTGMQSVATVEAVGKSVDRFEPGDVIFMRTAHTSHWTLPVEQCSPVPRNVERKNACWCGLAKTAFGACYAAPFEAGGAVLIVGAGPVGQMTVRWAKSMGMEKIAVVDIAPFRLQLAERGGATECIAGELAHKYDDVLRLTGGDGFDVVVDTTGNAAVFADALAVVGTFGKLVLLGDTGYPSRQCLTSDVMAKGLTIIATHDQHDRGGWTRQRVDELFFESTLR